MPSLAFFDICKGPSTDQLVHYSLNYDVNGAGSVGLFRHSSYWYEGAHSYSVDNFLRNTITPHTRKKNCVRGII